MWLPPAGFSHESSALQAARGRGPFPYISPWPHLLQGRVGHVGFILVGQGPANIGFLASQRGAWVGVTSPGDKRRDQRSQPTENREWLQEGTTGEMGRRPRAERRQGACRGGRVRAEQQAEMGRGRTLPWGWWVFSVPFSSQGRSELLKTPTSAKLPGSWPPCHRLSFVSNWPVAVTPPMPSTSASLGRRSMAPVSGSPFRPHRPGEGGAVFRVRFLC